MNPNKILETMPSTEKMMEWYDSLPKVQGKCHAKYQWFQDTILIDHCIKIRGKGAVEQTFHEHLYGLARGCLLCKKGAMVTPAGQRLYQMSGFFEQKGRWPTKRDKCELVYEPDWLYKVVLSRFPTSGMEEFEAFETHCYLRVL